MAHVRGVADLLPIFPNGFDETDLLQALRQRGHSIEADFAAKIETSRPAFRLSAEARRRARAKIPAGTTLAMRVADRSPRSAAAPINDYDIVAALRLSFANTVILQLREDGVIPNTLPLDKAKLLFSAETLALFQLAKPVVQHGHQPVAVAIDGEAAGLSFTESPELIPLDVAERVGVLVPFRLDVRLHGRGNPSHSAIVGKLRIELDLDPSFSADNSTLRLTLDTSRARSASLIVDPHSPLVPLAIDSDLPFRPATQLAAINAALLLKISQGLALLPPITLPPLVIPTGTGNASIVPLRVDAGSTGSGTDAALVVGVQTPGNASKPPQPLSPFTGGSSNAFVRLHENFLSRTFQAIALDPTFAAQLAADSGIEGLQIDGASVDAKPGRLEVRVEGRIVNLCAFRKDLRFSSLTTVTFSQFNGSLTVTRESELDINNLDVFLCVLLSGVEVVLFGLVFSVIANLIRLRRLPPGLLGGSGDGDDDGEASPQEDVFSSTFTTATAIPGTELAVSAELLEQKIDSSAVFALGRVALVPDTTSTFVYAICRRAGVALAAARVDLVDQDAPPPAGDDVMPVPTIGAFTPGSDQVLGSASTRADGSVQFSLAAAARGTQAGVLRATVAGISLSIPVPEARPDLYLRIVDADGIVLDSRGLPGGFSLNQAAGHFGTRNAPMVLDFP